MIISRRAYYSSRVDVVVRLLLVVVVPLITTIDSMEAMFGIVVTNWKVDGWVATSINVFATFALAYLAIVSR